MLGQHLIIGIASTEISADEIGFLKEYRPVGLFLTSRNFLHDASYAEIVANQKALLADFKKHTGRDKIFVCLDHEGGRVTHLPEPFTTFEYARSWKASAKEVAQIKAEQLKSLGINFLFGPVVDIASNWRNPVIGPRAFADTATDVITAAKEYCAVLEDAGILYSLKHFPGHGDTKADSHFGIPALELTLAELEQRELLPFRKLNQAPVIMCAHVLLNKLDCELPVSLSKKVLSDVLREQLNFKGLVVTDDIAMHALSKNFTVEEICKKNLSAGGDLVLLAHNAAKVISENIKPNQEFGTKESKTRISNSLSSVLNDEPKQLATKSFTKADALYQKIENKSGLSKYIEAEPLAVLPPESQDQTVKIGVVLAEDDFKKIGFVLKSDAIIKSGDGSELALRAGTYELCLKNLRFFLYQDIQYLGDFAAPLFLNLVSDHSGITIKNVTVGRSFHWEDSVDETFTGALKFTTFNRRIVVINLVDFEDYVAAVVGSEMSGKDLPTEFIKAQAITARSWAYVGLAAKYPDQEYDLCNDDMSQRYRGITDLSKKILEATAETKGEYLLASDGSVVPAWYYKSCGGRTTSASDIFNISYQMPGVIEAKERHDFLAADLADEQNLKTFLNLPREQDAKIFCSTNHLKPELSTKYVSAVDVQTDYHRWELTVDFATISKRVKAILDQDISEVIDLEVLERCSNGRVLKMKILHKTDGKEQQLLLENQLIIRLCLHTSCLYSSAFLLEKTSTGFNFNGFGWGHGIGLCQIGAVSMAVDGFSYQEILKHYYPLAELS